MRNGAQRRRTLASNDSGAELTTQAWKPLRPAPRAANTDNGDRLGSQPLDAVKSNPEPIWPIARFPGIGAAVRTAAAGRAYHSYSEMTRTIRSWLS